MDSIVIKLLASLDQVAVPKDDASAWKAPFDRLVAGVACLIQSRSAFLLRETSTIYRNHYHEEVRQRLPTLLREATEAHDGHSVDWQRSPLALWSCGLFVNDAEVRIATALEKILRIFSGDFSSRSRFPDLVRAVAAAIGHFAEATGVCRQLLAAEVRDTHYYECVLAQLIRVKSNTSEQEIFDWITADAQRKGWALAYIWRKYNRQKHDAQRKRDWVEEEDTKLRTVPGMASTVTMRHLLQTPIWWGILAGAMISVLDIYQIAVVMRPDIDDLALRQMQVSKRTSRGKNSLAHATG